MRMTGRTITPAAAVLAVTAIVLLFSGVYPVPSCAAGEEILPFEPDDTLEEIRYKIDHNGYSFTVSDNPIFSMPLEEKTRFLSRRRPEFPRALEADPGIGPLAEHLGKKALPSSFDWRNYGGRAYIGAVRDQGDTCGSCYAFGAVAAAEGTYNFANGFYGSNRIEFSESYIAWCLGRLPAYNSHFFGCGGADYDYMELEALTKEGIILRSQFPYRETDPGSCAYWGLPTTKFASWHRVPCNDIDAIKTAIMTYGVVDAAVYVGSAFQAYDSGVYQDSNTTCYSNPCYYTPTNHAIALVGWDDNPPEGGGGVWILRNSWDNTWGEDGYMRIRYTSARVACEVSYLVYGSSPATSTTAPLQLYAGDFSGNGKSDIAIFRPSSGLWSVRGITRAYFGQSGDIPIPADFNGDGTSDIAVFRPSSGLWSVRGRTRFYFGSSDDTPVPMHNTTGLTAAVFRDSSGLWATRGGARVYFGQSGDLPVPGPYSSRSSNRGSVNYALFRPSAGLWAIRGLTRFYYGGSSDTPVPGAYTTGSTDVWRAAIFRPSSGLWSVRGVTRAYFGGSADIPVPADYAGTWGDEMAIFRPSTGLWAIRGVGRYYYGGSVDIPVTR